MTFGNLMAEFSNGGGGWAHDVSFSASGNKLAWVGHDSSISVANAAHENQVVTVKSEFRPFVACSWVTENSLVVAGHDCWPALYNHDDQDKLTFINKLNVSSKKAGGGAMSAMDKFRHMDKRATTTGVKTELESTHQNTITDISIHTGGKQNASKFTTSGVDGRLVNWTIKSLEAAIAGLKFQ